jgi:L-fuculose-phosphate aldolase
VLFKYAKELTLTMLVAPSETAEFETFSDDPRMVLSMARRILHREGLDSQIAGHVSLRVPGEEAFWVNSFGYSDETLPEHVSKVGFDLKVLEPGTMAASPGINFHSNIYVARPEVNCIVHVHARNAVVLSSTNVPFAPYFVYGTLFHEDVAYFEDDPLLTPDVEGVEICAALGDKRVLMMKYHGALHVGSSVQEGVIDAVAFEMSCERQLAAMAVGGKPMDDGPARNYRKIYREVGFHNIMWEANCRRLRRSDPDLFDRLG